MSGQEQPAAFAHDRLLEKHRLPSGTVIVVAVGAIGLLQILTPVSTMHWLYVWQRLYYLPIVLAGLKWGRPGGLGIAILAGALFAVGTPAIWTVSKVDVLDQCLEVVVFVLVGLVTGILSDRQKKYESVLWSATQQLNSLYRELQANFEGMKRAERLFALGQLSAGLAHEIRNPLASIEGAALVVQTDIHSEERRREFLEIIQKECRRLNRLLASFLDFAKPRPPQLRTVQVDALLESVILLVNHAKQDGHVRLEMQVQAGVSTVECDPEQLKQVLLNLTMNAAQATPERGTILLTATQSGTHLAIGVHDSGPGINRDDLERIFDPFFTTKESGTGLGLSVAHQIVTQHGGTLVVARNSPQGATFQVSLPLRQPTRTESWWSTMMKAFGACCKYNSSKVATWSTPPPPPDRL
jgi:two-component system sensor histidine kinase HydH